MPSVEPTSNHHGEDLKSRKPSDSNFKQQRLPAWHPILTAGTVLPTFFVIGVAFIPIGVGMLYFSSNVMEKEIDYTNCLNNGTNTPCYEFISNMTANVTETCICIVDFEIDQDWPTEVHVYYGLTNFYQNHRRYVKSRDDSQLLGIIDVEPSPECDPYVKVDNKNYIPCGAIANSMFSDTIEIMYTDSSATGGSQLKKVDLLRRGIAWESDKNYKFKNPTVPGGKTLREVFESHKYLRPKNWHVDLWDLDPTDPDNNGLQNEDLMVWMRTAALPNFRKLYRRVNHTGTFANGFPKNKYKLVITYRFEVKKFSGTKSVILSTTSILGGKNPFLGVAYIVVGCCCLIMGVIFLFVHIKYGKSTIEMMNITTRTPYN